MPLNPQIPLMAGHGVPGIKSPGENMKDALTLKELAQGVQTKQLAMDEAAARRKASQEGASIFAEAQGDLRTAAKIAAERGLFDHAQSFESAYVNRQSEMAKARESLLKMNETQRKTALDRIQELGKASQWILSQPPELQQKAYDLAVNSLPGLEDMRGQEMDPQDLMMFASQAEAFGKIAEDLKPMTSIGKLNWELKNKMISQADYDAAVRKETTHAPGTQVNINNTQEKEEGKTVGKGFGETYNRLQDAGLSASGKLARYERMGALLDGVKTGKLTPTKVQLAGLADGLGIKIDPKLGEKQALEAMSNEIALTLRNPSGGAGMPGALSDKDLAFLSSMTPGLAKTTEGNLLIIDAAKKLAQREIDVARIAREYRKKNGTLDEGFYDELAAFSEANPLFGPEAGKAKPVKPTNKPIANIPAALLGAPKEFLDAYKRGERVQGPDGRIYVIGGE